MNDLAGPRRLLCLSSETETADVRTFTFRMLDEDAPAFLPGQAMTLSLVIDGTRALRTFSLAAPPRPDGTLTMTIKAQPSRGVTHWMHANLLPGTVIEAHGPHGRFLLPAALPDRLALVSAGSGASPLVAMLRHLETAAPGTDVTWLHAARTADDILFSRELVRLQGSMPRLAVSVTLSRPGPGWFGYRGRVSRRLLSVAVPDFGRREVFCCGPQGFMRDVRLSHAAEGGAAARFHIEHFGDGPLPAHAAEPSRTAPSTEAYRVRLGTRLFTVEPGETVLEAATRQVVVIPCGCASGLCGTCRTRLVEGRVEMHHQGGLAADEEADGYILACSARPLTDLVLTL